MFSIKTADKTTKARTGIINTPHGTIKTPFFMPVATKGAIKFASPHEAIDLGYDCIISNALVNSFRPGIKLIKDRGGLHKFIGWDRAITTDSGGFQLLRESFLIKTTEDGAIFRNPFNGNKVKITPENLIGIQEDLGSDIAMVLDDVPKFGVTHREAFISMQKTHEWARRCRMSHKRSDQLLFGIAQGNIYSDLREHSAKYISSLGFDGVALGGLALGEPTRSMMDMIRYTIPFLPIEKPRYLMGVGSPEDIVISIGEGIDMFDSTFPTSNARHNTLFTFSGKLRITSKKFREDFRPVEENCQCPCCKNHSRAFLHHLKRCHEPLGMRLATLHNLYFMNELVSRARKAIETNNYNEFVEKFLKDFKDQ